MSSYRLQSIWTGPALSGDLDTMGLIREYFHILMLKSLLLIACTIVFPVGFTLISLNGQT